MKPEVQEAFWEWLAGLGIGLLPLLAHWLIATVAKSPGGEPTSWTPDVLFVAITTSGMSAVTVFIRLAKGTLGELRLDGPAYLLMTVTMLFFVLAGIYYGVVAAGLAKDQASWLAWTFVGGSALASLYFELTLAGKITPRAKA